jgi:hypothetical protein
MRKGCCFAHCTAFIERRDPRNDPKFGEHVYVEADRCWRARGSVHARKSVGCTVNAPGASAPEPIDVTATKRAEPIQDVPILPCSQPPGEANEQC